jgi:dolichol kinase
VGPAYEDLVAGLARAGQRAPSLRPTNYARNIFHVCSGLFALAVIELWTEQMPYIAGGFLTSAVLMESSRRVSPRANEVLMGAFGKVAHPYERHRINSASWYALALVLLALFVPPLGCAVGVVVLGFGDPMAAIVGRRFGRTKLPGGRSLEGSMAFVVAGTLPGMAVLALAHQLTLGAAAAVALAGATAGAAAEVLSGRLDDNFTIPTVAGLAAWGAQTLFG